MAAATVAENKGDFTKSTFPILFPFHKAMNYDDRQFSSFLAQEFQKPAVGSEDVQMDTSLEEDDSLTLVDRTRNDVEKKADETTHPFMQAIHSQPETPDTDNKMFTANADVAHQSTKNALVDLFYELEEGVSGSRLEALLPLAWKENPLAALKVIFNARSIHLGKSTKLTMYRCFGWLAENHPVTLLENLQWLSRPVIQKKVEKETEDDVVLVEAEKEDDDKTRFDVKNGVAHGYWKDLLNILVLAVEGKLSPTANPRDILNVEMPKSKKEHNWDHDKAKAARATVKQTRHEAAEHAFNNGPFYRALHLTVARLFVAELRVDLALLRAGDKKSLRQISLCGKWAPSPTLFHDKHTFICSTIAEQLHPQSQYPDIGDRELYLRHAREAYRRDISALRKQLGVVERLVSAEKFSCIQYDRVPSLAMSRYNGLFARKDFERFDEYITGVAEGKNRISGAVLLPSKMVSRVRGSPAIRGHQPGTGKKGKNMNALVQEKIDAIQTKVIDGQWNALVQRIKDSGTLENSMAICDVSGSMSHPTFPDGTCPMDSAIGLSLLLAEVTKAPFGGSFITFSEIPKVVKVTGGTFSEKVNNMASAHWGGSTNFVAVFEELILPLARQHNVKHTDMIKQLFVFSDMQFNAAAGFHNRWTTSYERIKRQYQLYGYEMPKIVFWNLASGAAGYGGMEEGIAPKPVTVDEQGTSLVSGYSQGMLKVFLDSGSFENDPESVEEEITEQEAVDSDGDEVLDVQVKKKVKVDPLITVKKAISHKAYDMLKVVD